MARSIFLLILLGIVYTKVIGQRSNNDAVRHGFLFKILQATSFSCSGKVPEKIVVASDDDDDDSDLEEVVSTNTQKDEK